MSRGLGRTQRAVLFVLARLEIAAAEAAAERQQRYQPPTWRNIHWVFDNAVEHELHEHAVARLRAVHDQQQRIEDLLKEHAEAGDKDAKILSARRRKVGEFDPNQKPSRHQLDDYYNPSRVLRSLLGRGLISTRHPILSFAHGVALQPAGLALACQIGGINSEIVDLDRLIAEPWIEARLW